MIAMSEEIINILLKIKEDFGIEAFENSRRINSILMDVAPEYKKERIQIVNIINAGGYREFKNNYSGYDFALNKVINTLVEDYGIRMELARKSALAFGKLFYEPMFEQPVKPTHYKGRNRIAVGNKHTVILADDGTVIALGDNSFGQCDCRHFVNIKEVFAKNDITIGISHGNKIFVAGDIYQKVDFARRYGKVFIEQYFYAIDTDGGIIAPEGNKLGTLTGFTDLTQLALGAYHILGLKNNGKVVSAGSNEKQQCEVFSWRGITSVAAGFWFSVGLKQDGTVLATGSNVRGQCNVSGFTDISEIFTSYDRTIGLCHDGTVVATGNNEFGQCNVGGWKDVIHIIACDEHTIGLTKHGTVYATGKNNLLQCDVEEFNDVVEIASGDNHTVALRRDGTLLECGLNDCGQCNVEGIQLKLI